MTATTATDARIGVDIATAAELVGFSADTIRRAIRKTKADGVFPPPLAAKRTPKGYRIRTAALEAWFDALPDA